MRVSLVMLCVLTALALAACTSGNTIPTPTVVPLTQAVATPTQAPTPTPIPFPSSTPTPTPTPAPALPLASSTPFSAGPLEPAATPAAVMPAAQVEVVSAGLNLRDGPGTTYPVIGTARKGDRFEITGRTSSGNWLQVKTSTGSPAWVSGGPAYTRLLGSLETVPVVAAPAPAAQGSTAAGSGQAGGQLVFMTGSGGDLYVINVAGTGLRHLASGVIDPVVSPDGRQVAFTRWDGAEFGTLYTLNLDGTGERAVIGESRQAKSPAWSPDGADIIFSFQYGGLRDPQMQCRTFDRDDGIRIPEDAVIDKVHVNQNTGGVTICYTRREDLEWRLRRVNLQTGKFEDLPVDLYSYNPAWDPANPWRVIYDGSKGLMQLDVNQGKQWPVTTDLRDSGPVFSPDGQKLALTYKQHDHWEVYTLDLATGARARLTKPPLLATPQYNSAAPAWSPDGSQLAFVTDRNGRWEIWVMNADGSNQHPMFAPEVQAQLGLNYQGVNERMLNWIR